mmetsp:Transcript_9078/g.15051  ORF Transcript_9078/g.15051 Transcript_9078/m.15051 type:complete len:494 (+) Transcript_9078:43-1524(+)
MANFHRLLVPSFDVAWCALSEDDQVALIAGGGGSFKSGVKNQIQIARVYDGDKVTFMDSYITDMESNRRLCCGLACGTIGEHSVVVALLDSDCVILALEMNADSSSVVSFTQKADFRADFATEDSSLNCCLVTRTGLVVTGGEDHICRVWRIDGDLSLGSTPWKVTLSAALLGHDGPVMALSFHPSEQWLCTAAKDGSCKIWDAEAAAVADRKSKQSQVSGTNSSPRVDEEKDDAGKEAAAAAAAAAAISAALMVCDVPCNVDGVTGTGSASAAAVLSPLNGKAGGPTMQCRGCCFSTCGQFLYSIQSGKRGPTHLIQWSLRRKNIAAGTSDTSAAGSAKEKAKNTIDAAALECIPVKMVVAAPVPCTSLQLDLTGDFLAVGSSEGRVVCFSTQHHLRQLASFACHDLPVTGMGFAPPNLAHSLGMKAVITTCSADRKLAVLKVGGYSVCFKITMLLVLLMVLIILALYSTSLWLLLAEKNIIQPTGDVHLEL